MRPTSAYKCASLISFERCGRHGRQVGDRDTVRRRWNRNDMLVCLAMKAFLIDPLLMKRTFEPLRSLGTHSFFFLVHGVPNELRQDVAAKFEGSVTFPPILSPVRKYSCCATGRTLHHIFPLSSPLPMPEGGIRQKGERKAENSASIHIDPRRLSVARTICIASC